MSRLFILTGNRYSIKELSKTIGAVAEQNGFEVTIATATSIHYTKRTVFNSAIIVYPFYPLFNGVYVAFHFEMINTPNKKSIYYTMTEGTPLHYLLNPYHRRIRRIYTPSLYAKKLLEKANITVDGIIPHGFPDFLYDVAEQLRLKYRNKIERDFKGKLVIGAIADSLPRKNADGLAEALKILATKRNDYVTLVMASQEVSHKFDNIPNTYLIGATGEQTHQEVLGWLGAVDLFVAPSMAEAFGLTVLEANYMGTPVVAPLLEPYREFANTDYNYFFEPDSEQEEQTKEGVVMKLAKYQPIALANAISDALDEAINSKDTFQERRARVAEKAQQFKASEIYKKLLELVK
jgi:glycosyltransferase involved in cell wall biosynthesis